jgi:hypothetical protein
MDFIQRAHPESSKQKQKAFKNQTISLIFKRFIYAASDNYLSN